MAVWTVKGGRSGEREDRLLQNGLIGGGWEGLPSLEHITSREALDVLYQTTFPSNSANTRGNYVGQLWSLIHRMQVGELVVMPLKTTGTIAIGELTGPYEYRTDLGIDLMHTRKVRWLQTDIPRDAFDQDLLYSFGAFMTFGQVQRDAAEERIRRVLSGTQHTPVFPPSNSDGLGSRDSGDLLVDVQELAREQVRQEVGRRFAGHDLSRLVGAVLEGQGYSATMSPPGADGGVDILAGSGPLGLDQPRLAVQVKTGTAGIEELRALIGVLDTYSADRGLLVAWGGFRGTVRGEARLAHFKVRLWDADALLDELFRVYQALPEGLRSELPLQPVWALVTGPQ